MEVKKPDDDGKTTEQRFSELGSKVMSASRAEVAALERKWQARRPPKSKKKR